MEGVYTIKRDLNKLNELIFVQLMWILFQIKKIFLTVETIKVWILTRYPMKVRNSYLHFYSFTMVYVYCFS